LLERLLGRPSGDLPWTSGGLVIFVAGIVAMFVTDGDVRFTAVAGALVALGAHVWAGPQAMVIGGGVVLGVYITEFVM
jgi:hypothetical protein